MNAADLMAERVKRWIGDRERTLDLTESDAYGLDEEIQATWDLIDRAQAFLLILVPEAGQ